MSSSDQTEIAVDMINMAINELDNEPRFEEACMKIGRIKGYLEISSAIRIISQEDNERLWEKLATIREKVEGRFKKRS